MMHLLLSVLVVLVAISIIPTVFSESLREEFAIPDWVKNTAGWWADGQIPDSAFLQGIQFLIKEEIITVQIPTVDSEAVEEVPGWVKNTVAWWAEGKIHDITFAGAIKYLLSQGIITVEQEQVEELVEETVEISDFYMEVNGDNCCQNWAYVGKDYLFQIETLDKHRGSPIDGVAITAKIISKDGELRYDFGQVATENGIYKNNIIIPSMDWYAGNILSVTGEYYGVEKTIEKEFEVFYESSKRQTCVNISCYTLTSVSNVVHGGAFTELDAPREIALFTIGSSTYVIVVAYIDDGFNIIDISTPSSPTSVGTCKDGTSCATKLNGVSAVAVTTIGGKTYAVTVSYLDDALSVFDISTPSSPTEVSTMAGSASQKLKDSYSVAIAEFDDKVYAVVTSATQDSIALVDISTPDSLAYKDHILNTDDGAYRLDYTVTVAIATIGGTTYAVTTATGGGDDGIAIIDISTDPTDLEYIGDMGDDAVRELNNPNGVAIATIGDKTYAVVVGNDNGINIIDITTPSSPTYVGEMEDDADKEPEYGRDVEIATINGRTYAFVAAVTDNGLAIIDITTPSSPTYVGEMEDDEAGNPCTTSQVCLDGPRGVVITTIDGDTYAIVTAYDDDGIEIIRVMG